MEEPAAAAGEEGEVGLSAMDPERAQAILAMREARRAMEARVCGGLGAGQVGLGVAGCRRADAVGPAWADSDCLS